MTAKKGLFEKKFIENRFLPHFGYAESSYALLFGCFDAETSTLSKQERSAKFTRANMTFHIFISVKTRITTKHYTQSETSNNVQFKSL